MTNTNHPGPEHTLLNAFVGKWNTSGNIKATSESEAVEVTGIDTYEWLPGGFFLLHKVDVQMGDEKNESIEIISFDAVTKTYRMQSFDNKGNTATMHASENKGTWVFLSESLRFTGNFSDDGNTLSGIWERSEDSIRWMRWMDIQLTRAT